jgi:hypothetical protein
MAVHRWCDALNKPTVNMVGIDHVAKFVVFSCRQRVDEELAAVVFGCLFSTNIGTILGVGLSVGLQKRGYKVTYPCVCVVDHACQECSLVL